jgi:hypothetical protein
MDQLCPTHFSSPLYDVSVVVVVVPLHHALPNCYEGMDSMGTFGTVTCDAQRPTAYLNYA